MASRTFILFAGHDAPWRLAVDARVSEITVEPRAPVARAAQAAAETMRRAGYGGQPVLLAIPSSWCMVSSISLDGLPRRHDRTARLYRLEEKLPLAAEEVVADFVGRGGRALGVAAPVERLKPLVDALEAQGIAIEQVAPTGLLAAQAAPTKRGPCVMLVAEGDAVNVLAFDTSVPVAWSVAPRQDVDLHVRVAQEISGAREVIHAEADATTLATFAGRSILGGRVRPWVNLRRDALASPDRVRPIRRALDALLTSAAVLLIALATTMLIRAGRYEAAARADEQTLIERFREEFPGWPVPANVAAVIDSEHRKLAAQQIGAARQASAGSALQLLTRVLGALPAAAHVAIERMAFDDRGGFVLDGRVAAPAELDAITASIRSANLRVAPPQAQRDDAGGGGGGTWHFTLRGETPGAAPPAVSTSAAPLAEVSR